VKGRRDPEAFEKEQENQKALQALADAGLIDLFHFDESGFTTVPSVPYAWQPVGTNLELPSFKSRRLNVLGFLSKGQGAFFRHTEGPVGTGQVVAAFDAFASRRAAEYTVHGRPCVVVLDNASWHTSRAFRDRLDDWATCGVVVHYLPAYSPELNPIETLWRKIKYDWLTLDCYASYQGMKSAVLGILDGFGSKYQICFV
jgi:hypothetical protein